MAPRLRFLADMNLSPITVDVLQQEGWDIVRVSTLLSAAAYSLAPCPRSQSAWTTLMLPIQEKTQAELLVAIERAVTPVRWQKR